MKKFLLFTIILLTCVAADAQKLSGAQMKAMRAQEEKLKELARLLITDTLTQDRMKADTGFIRTLVRTLQIPNSFWYSLENVKGISQLYAPDSSFRIFSWNLQYDEYYARQRGAIQMRTADGSLKLYGLIDVSEFTENAADSVRGANNWIGAIYYNIIRTEYKGKPYYTLFGLDHHSVRSTKKWIEVLSFNSRGEPVFGGNFFQYRTDSMRNRLPFRVQIEYKKDARVLVNYVPDLGMILLDHLISESNEPDNPWTLVPDGDNEAFKWENGKWVFIDKPFDYKIDMNGVDPLMGNPPVNQPTEEGKTFPDPGKKKSGGN